MTIAALRFYFASHGDNQYGLERNRTERIKDAMTNSRTKIWFYRLSERSVQIFACIWVNLIYPL